MPARRAIGTALWTGVPAGACYAIGTFDPLPGAWPDQVLVAFGPLPVVCADGVHAHFLECGRDVLTDPGYPMPGIAGVVRGLLATLRESVNRGRCVVQAHQVDPSPDGYFHVSNPPNRQEASS